MEKNILIATFINIRSFILNNQKDQAIFEIDAALSALGPVLQNKITEPEFIKVPGVKFKERGQYKTPSGMFSGLTVHYTVSGRKAANARSVLKYLAGQNFGCMVMDEAGKIYIPENFDVLKSWNYHAGVSKWKGATSVSNIFAGMEICCWGKDSKEGPFRTSQGQQNIYPGIYQQYTEAQEIALVNFCLWAKQNNPEFKIENITGHDELRTEAGKPGMKTDPGASLSMTMPQLRELISNMAKELGI